MEILKERPLNITKDDWEELEMMACSIIRCCLTNELLAEISVVLGVLHTTYPSY